LSTLQRWGGIAALVDAATFLFGIALLVTLRWAARRRSLAV
jgi:hypothetical protein